MRRKIYVFFSWKERYGFKIEDAFAFEISDWAEESSLWKGRARERERE